jgi:hypothetical protein
MKWTVVVYVEEDLRVVEAIHTCYGIGSLDPDTHCCTKCRERVPQDVLDEYIKERSWAQ